MPNWVASPLHRDIVVALIEARKSAGMTQRELAAKLDRPPSYVAKVETIERNLSAAEFIEWVRGLACDPAELVGIVTGKIS